MEQWIHAPSSDDLKVSHHAHVLMFQVVAMKNIASAIAGESDQNIRSLARPEVDGIFPAHVIWTRPATVSQHLKVNQVQMQRMAEICLQPPDFEGVKLRATVHTRRIERLSVDPPTMCCSLIAEIENTREGRIFRLFEGNIGELRRKIAIIPLAANDVEPHHLSRLALAFPIQKRDMQANPAPREIHDDIEAFRGCDSNGSLRQWRGEQPSGSIMACIRWISRGCTITGPLGILSFLR